MSHPDNEPGKTYDVDDRRRAAALFDCDGIPTEWLEAGFFHELYKFVAVATLCDRMSEVRDGYVRVPAQWWQENIRGSIDRLNEIAIRSSALKN
jgi:hypothetical protein